MQELRKTWIVGKLYPIRGVGGGGGVRPKAEKKIVSAISTFRHPLAWGKTTLFSFL